MTSHTIFGALRHALLVLFFGLVAGQAAAANFYHVEIDSNIFAGSGWLDLQFNPGTSAATGATAAISGFSGLLDATQAPQVSGNVAGALTTAVNFGNGTAFNDLFQAVVFGGKFSFDVSFGGAFLNSPGNVGTTFAVSLYGADQTTILGRADAVTASLVKFDLTPAVAAGQFGRVNATVFDGSVIQVTAVPEPETYAMLLAGLALLGCMARRKSKSAIS